MSQNGWIVAIVAVIIIGGGIWWWQSAQTPALSDDGTPMAQDTTEDASVQQTPAPTPTPTPTPDTSVPMSASVSYNGSSFSPSEVTIKKGGTVTFNGPSTMWVASGQHPSHTGYDGTSRTEHCVPGYTGATPFDECTQASSYSFTFDKTGTWPYHDHMNPAAFGKVTVVE